MMRPYNEIRIVIVKDHKLFRKGLRLILNGEEDIEIVGEAANRFQAIDMITDLKPDVVLLDITTPDMDSIKILPIIKQKSPETKVLILTVSKEESSIVKFLNAGAKGYLSKNTSTSSLIKAIKVVHEGQLWVERTLIARFFNGHIITNSSRKDRQLNNKEDLTLREQDVLRLLSKGFTNKEIANDLSISEKTVKSHLHKIFKKLNVGRRLEAILYAIKIGLA